VNHFVAYHNRDKEGPFKLARAEIVGDPQRRIWEQHDESLEAFEKRVEAEAKALHQTTNGSSNLRDRPDQRNVAGSIGFPLGGRVSAASRRRSNMSILKSLMVAAVLLTGGVPSR
jgi:hypothetical protein